MDTYGVVVADETGKYVWLFYTRDEAVRAEGLLRRARVVDAALYEALNLLMRSSRSPIPVPDGLRGLKNTNGDPIRIVNQHKIRIAL